MKISSGAKVLIASCGAHLIQDGLSALQFVLLPILAQLFGLSYTQVGILRAITSSVMAALEIPAGILSERFGEPKLIIFGLLLAGLGYIGIAMADQYYLIVIGFFATGAGSAFQHCLASALISNQFETGHRRKSLGLYNAAGDAGKLSYTGLFSLAVGMGLAWNLGVVLLSIVAMIFALLLIPLTRKLKTSRKIKHASEESISHASLSQSPI